MQDVQERSRRPSPAPLPHAIAYHDGRLWIGSWETNALYALDPSSWQVAEQHAAPGKPFGIASHRGGLTVTISLGEEDDRYLYRCIPGKGFDESSKTPCPEFTGSYLASNGSMLYLGQMGNRRVLALDADLAIASEIALPTRCAGIGFGPGGAFFMISGDDELEHLKLAKLDVAVSHPALGLVAAIPFDARSLAYDGSVWWTNERERGEIVSFTA